ncbi:hypothetical protein H6P81_002279 [Aristolochia fimbriata]|uniref:Uncharacterized protein n=1 Tax=Aristolochia fimbriata TaxID=158543 RepID=A0AAV7FD70_ARIFI|nr:hypothetical protein H6P81_002279 [Aristolochia fimbriata]
MEKQMQTFIDVFEAETKDAERVQREVLERILKENGEAEYLKKFGLDGKWDEETFRKCVPLASHHDLMPYINRIADRDASPLLAAKPFTALSWSSGTTGGKPKLVPFNLALSSTVTLHTTCLAYALREFSVTEGMFLSDIRVSDPVVRGSVSKLLKPNPDLADSIYQKCKVLQSENWYGSIPELWPQAKFVTTILTGSMEAYVGKLRHYAGDKFSETVPDLNFSKI